MVILMEIYVFFCWEPLMLFCQCYGVCASKFKFQNLKFFLPYGKLDVQNKQRLYSSFCKEKIVIQQAPQDWNGPSASCIDHILMSRSNFLSISLVPCWPICSSIQAFLQLYLVFLLPLVDGILFELNNSHIIEQHICFK